MKVKTLIAHTSHQIDENVFFFLAFKNIHCHIKLWAFDVEDDIFIWLFLCILFSFTVACMFYFILFGLIVIDAQGSIGPLATALFLGDPALFNTTREDCIWKRGNDRDQCPDPDITMTLFPAKNSHAKSKVRHLNSKSSILHGLCVCFTIEDIHTNIAQSLLTVNDCEWKGKNRRIDAILKFFPFKLNWNKKIVSVFPSLIPSVAIKFR